MLIAAILSSSCTAQSDKNQSEYKLKVILQKEGVKYAYPHWSSDGKKILFQSDESDLWQIYIANKDGTNLIQVTSGEFNNYMADWSPNDSLIAFVSDRSGNEDIFTTNIYDTTVSNLTKNPARDIHPYWSPDGNRILFNSTRSDTANWSLDVFEMNKDGSGVIQLSRGNDVETCARLSPTKDRIVFLKMNYESGKDDIVIFNPDGSGEMKITDDGDRDGWPTWSPDGSKILFSSMYYGKFCLHTINQDGQDRKMISEPEAGQNDCRAEFSPDGTKILFNRDLNDSTIAILIMDLPELKSE